MSWDADAQKPSWNPEDKFVTGRLTV
jgi:hypothetical protein